MSSIRSLLGSPTAQRVFIAAAVLYLILWTLAPPLIIPSLPLDVVEGITWGREWQLGYYKHPPFSSWVLHLFHTAFGHVGPFLLSQLCVLLALWMVWLTGRRVTSVERAFLGTLLTLGIVHYTRSSVEFNHNVAQIPVWAALGYCLLAALQDGRKRQWIMLGVVAGVGMLTKYSVGFLLICQALYLLLSSDRRVLRTPGPWLALGAMAVMLAPHLYWLVQTEFLPVAYVSSRATGEQSVSRPEVFQFPLVQILNHLPLAVIVLSALFVTRKARKAAPAKLADWRLTLDRPAYMLAIGLGPCVFLTVIGFVAGLRVYDMWGQPMWIFSGLLVAASLPQAWLAILRPKLLNGLLVWLVLVSIITWGVFGLRAQVRGFPARTDWPMHALAQQADVTWGELSSCSLKTVAGQVWVAGLVVANSAAKPSILIDGESRISPWVTQEQLKTNGLLWVWQDEGDGEAERVLPPPLLTSLPPEAGLRPFEGVWHFPWHYSATAKPLAIKWRAYVPEACLRAGK